MKDINIKVQFTKPRYSYFLINRAAHRDAPGPANLVRGRMVEKMFGRLVDLLYEIGEELKIMKNIKNKLEMTDSYSYYDTAFRAVKSKTAPEVLSYVLDRTRWAMAPTNWRLKEDIQEGIEYANTH